MSYFVQESKSGERFCAMHSGFDAGMDCNVNTQISGWFKDRKKAERVCVHMGNPVCYADNCDAMATHKFNAFGNPLLFDSPTFSHDIYTCDEHADEKTVQEINNRERDTRRRVKALGL